MTRGKAKADPHAQALREGLDVVRRHPLTRPLAYTVGLHVHIPPQGATGLHGGWGHADAYDGVTLYGRRHGDAAEWAWVATHLLLHLGLGHGDPDGVLARAGLRSEPAGRDSHVTDAAVEGAAPTAARQSAATAACCAAVLRLQGSVGIGRRPHDVVVPGQLTGGDETRIAEHLARNPVDLAALAGIGCNADRPDAYALPEHGITDFMHERVASYPDLLARGISGAVDAALEVAGGRRSSITDSGHTRTRWQVARAWMLDAYPLLGSVIATMTVVDDLDIARSLDVDIAAVEPGRSEIIVNPLTRLTVEEWKFVLAHEALHAALGHDRRSGGRDHYFYNVAADYVINGWLIEMAVGDMPTGLLYDPDFAGLSAEDVYDRITVDLRRLRKLRTLRGQGVGDMLERRLGDGHDYTDKDAFYRRALADGLALHDSQGRGRLPAGLVEEIRVREHPPVPWDVRLAAWFDEHVPAPERARSYSRASRRQSSTPDIARPGTYWPEAEIQRCTFGVVLDTSGSMSNRMLASALGAISSFALARDVPRARVVFCDAAARDAGYLDVEAIAGRVRVHGRGGTVLQPGVNLLERAPDFPAAGPILIITDGFCDPVRVRREHAFLVPRGATLPFKPRGPVFRMEAAATKHRG